MIMQAPTPGPPPGLSEWAAVVGSLAPVLTLLVVLVAFLAYLQKSKADKRSQWWVRAQWGIESTFSDDDRRQEIGLVVMDSLDRSGLATKEDHALFSQTAFYAVQEQEEELLAEDLEASSGTGHNGEQGGEHDDQH
jgi:hypothetical protein